MDNVILKTNNLTKEYKHNEVVSKVSLTICKGEIYGLVGNNGAGKSTFLKMICGLTIPTGGEIQLFDRDSGNKLYKNLRRVGNVIETPCFFPNLSAKKNLECYQIERGIVDKNLIAEVLDTVELRDTASKPFKKFSMGMKQRLGLALALLSNPDFLILDEPINGLDPTGIVEIRELLLRLNREREITILISSHILEELSLMATRYGFINKGVLIEELTAEQLAEKCKAYTKLIVNNSSKAVIALEKITVSENFKVFPNNEIQLYDTSIDSRTIGDIMLKNGIAIYELSRTSQNLESYFLRLVGGC